jgi:hypothetical protein
VSWVFRYSLKEMVVILLGVTISFGSGFLHLEPLGFFNLAIPPGVAMTVCIFTVLYLVKRLAITIGLMLALAGALGGTLSWWSQTKGIDFKLFVFLFCFTAAPNLFFAVPLTLLRRSDGPLDPQFK